MHSIIKMQSKFEFSTGFTKTFWGFCKTLRFSRFFSMSRELISKLET